MKPTKLLLIVVFSFIIFSCSDDNSVSPDTEAVYSGLTNQNLPVSITTKNIDGSQKVIAYSLEYQYDITGGSYSGSSSQTDSEGLVNISNNQFVLSLSENSSDFISGIITSNSIIGDFSVSVVTQSSDTPIVITGTFTVYAH